MVFVLEPLGYIYLYVTLYNFFGLWFQTQRGRNCMGHKDLTALEGRPVGFSWTSTMPEIMALRPFILG